MKYFLYLLSVIVLSSCSPSCSVPCDKPTSVAGLITGSLSSVGHCNESGARLIAADVSKVVGGLGLCSNNKAGAIAMVVCAPAIAVLGKLASNELNSKYPGCDFSLALQSSSGALVDLCNQLPF